MFSIPLTSLLGKLKTCSVCHCKNAEVWKIDNCSQAKFIAIILVRWSFYAIFRLNNLWSDPFDLSSAKTVNARRPLSSHRSLRLTSV